MAVHREFPDLSQISLPRGIVPFIIVEDFLKSVLDKT